MSKYWCKELLIIRYVGMHTYVYVCDACMLWIISLLYNPETTLKYKIKYKIEIIQIPGL